MVAKTEDTSARLNGGLRPGSPAHRGGACAWSDRIDRRTSADNYPASPIRNLRWRARISGPFHLLRRHVIAVPTIAPSTVSRAPPAWADRQCCQVAI